jgi:vacuolar-type H+-ATPase subunit C/Vma6
METQTKGGPKTEEGKAVSRYNAVKHGLLTKQVYIDEEEKSTLEELTNSLYETLEPEGMLEELLVDRIVSNLWRLRRAVIVERSTMEWHQNDFDLFPVGQSDTQQERKSVRDMLTNDNIEKLLRYETTIERSTFRALHELERLQAKRTGKDVPTPAVVDVNVDGGNGFVSQK